MNPVFSASGASLLTACLCHVRARRGQVRHVRAALEDADPDIRRAAVVVASRDGVHRHLKVFLERIRTDASPQVLSALAEAAVDCDWKGADKRRRSRELRAWAAAYLAPSPRTTALQPANAVGATRPHKDHMSSVAPTQSDPPTRPAHRPVAGGLSRTRQTGDSWTAGLHEIDPLEVFAGLAHQATSSREWAGGRGAGSVATNADTRCAGPVPTRESGRSRARRAG